MSNLIGKFIGRVIAVTPIWTFVHYNRNDFAVAYFLFLMLVACEGIEIAAKGK